MATIKNPFRIHGVVEDQYFTNRAEEVDRIIRTLREPAAKLLVYGARRMGKTSALKRAVDRVESDGGHAIMADLSTASSLADIGNRMMAAAAKTLGRRWQDIAQDFVKRLKASLVLTVDPATGLIVPSLDVSLRTAEIEDQRKTLHDILDAIEGMAVDRDTNIGVVLDEFQEVFKIGGDRAEWYLRGVIQPHQRISYVLSGSTTHLLERMTDQGQAFYGMLDVLPIGSIDPVDLATWIDSRMQATGVNTDGVGNHAVALAGPRTRDIVRLARKCYDRTRAEGTAGTEDVVEAFGEIVEEEDDVWQSLWNGLTVHQQNVLRAIAITKEGLTKRATLGRFSLGSSGSTTNTAAALVKAGHLLKTAVGSGYDFDNPYFKGWVIFRTLADIGFMPPSLSGDKGNDL